MFEVGEHSGLLGLRLGPIPLLHEFFRKRVAIEGAPRAIDPRTRVTVVPPSATDIAGAVVHPHGKAHLAQVMQGIHAADTRPDDHHVIVFDRSAVHSLPLGS